MKVKHLDSLILNSVYGEHEQTMEAWRAMEEAVQIGLVRQLGISVTAAAAVSLRILRRVYTDALLKPAVVEIWLLDDPAIRKFCVEGNIQIQSYWMDIALQGFWKNAADANDEFEQNMTRLTVHYGMKIPALMYRFVMGLGIVPIVGVADGENMRENAMSWQIPLTAPDAELMDDMYDRAQQHLEAFYIEVFLELANYGEIEDLVVVDNLCDHMIGNVYVKYYHEEDAERALMKLTGRFYSGKLIQAEYTTVSDFREARCRAFHETRCNRGAYCNFMHIKHIPRAIKRRVVREMYDDHPEYLGQTRGRRDKDKDKDKDKDRDRERKKDKDRDGDKDRNRSRSRRRDKEKKERGGDNDGAPPARQTSEERRAMIAQWNQEREGGGGVIG